MPSPNADDTPQDEPLPEDDAPAGEVVAEAEHAPAEGEAGEGEQAANDADSDELVITLGDEPPPEAEAVDDTPVIRQMRQRLRDQARELINLRRTQTAAPAAPVQPEVADPGPMPKIEDVEFDNEKHAEAVAAWVERKTAADSAKAKAQQALQEQQQAWLTRVQGYEAEKKALKVPNFAEAEDNVLQALSLAQQGLLLKSKDHAKLVYALGNSPKRLQALAAITDPVDFVYAVAEVRHKELKVQQRSKPPVPERVPSGGSANGAGNAIATTKRLNELQEAARKSGDYTQYHAEKRRVEGRRAA